MKNLKTLDDLLSLNYTVVVNKTDDIYFLSISELNIIVKDKKLDEAYKKLEIEKMDYFQNIISINAQSTVSEPESINKIVKSNISEIISYFYKISIAVIIILSLTIGTWLLIGPAVSHKVYSDIIQIPTKVIRTFNNRITTMPKSEFDKKTSELRKTIQTMKPIIDEFRILFIESDGIEQVDTVIVPIKNDE